MTEQATPVTLNVTEQATPVTLLPTQREGIPGPPGPAGADGSVGPQGPEGPQGPAFGSRTVSSENKSGVTIYAGQAVAQHSSGVGFVLADKTASGTRCVGLATADADNGFAVTVQTEDVLELADWTEATGATSLVALARYYLSASGQLTTTPPSTGGEYLQFVGEPVSPQKLAIHIAEPIRRE